MGLLGLLRSLDELLYELVSWLLFFPLTLWRSLVRPGRMMDHGDDEATGPDPRRYVDGLSPPLFLFLALLLAHVVELTLVGESGILRSNRGASALVDSDTNLVIARALLFSVLPLTMAAWLLVRRGVVINRDTLRPPFFAQCYAVAVFALSLSIGLTLIRIGGAPNDLAGLVLIVGATIWYFVVQVRWLARHLGQSVVRSIADAAAATAVSTAIVVGVGSLFT